MRHSASMSQPMLTYCELDSEDNTCVKFYPRLKNFHENAFETVFFKVFKFIIQIVAWALAIKLPQTLTNKNSALVHVMASCRQATSHYLSQCQPRSLSSHCITRPNFVNFHSSSSVLMKTPASFSCLMASSSRTWSCVWPDHITTNHFLVRMMTKVRCTPRQGSHLLTLNTLKHSTSLVLQSLLRHS